MKKKKISLSYELADIEAALGAVRVLAEALRNEDMATEQDHRDGPAWCAAITTLCIARLRLLGLAINGSLNPNMLWSHQTAALPGIEHDDELRDSVLTEWSAKRREREARSDLRRAQVHQRPRPGR